MVRHRLSVSGLSGVVLLAALGLAAIRNASDPWAAAVVTLAAMMLGVGFLGCLFRRGPKRAFWAGFTLLGLGYFVAAFGLEQPQSSLVSSALAEPLNELLNPPASDYQFVMADGTVISTHYGTKGSLEALKADYQKRWDAGDTRMVDPSTLGIAPHVNTFAADQAREPLRRILHALGALTVGGLGGVIARYFRSTRGGAGAPSEA